MSLALKNKIKKMCNKMGSSRVILVTSLGGKKNE
jgi:hypothetical protein